MERIKCILSYDGTNFSGYQIQPNGRTVQEELERALTKIHKGIYTKVTASGRTDAGVHAVGQVVHFDTSLTIPEDNWSKALNAILPEDIHVNEVVRVSENFHARFDVREKEYRYFVDNSHNRDLFKRNYMYHFNKEVDLEAITKACTIIMGEHDFSSFCAANSGVKGDKVRTIYHASCVKQGSNLVFTFRGSGFLYNMVRILVGTLIEIGSGKRNPHDMYSILDAKDRSEAGKTAPAQGLFLWNVIYDHIGVQTYK